MALEIKEIQGKKADNDRIITVNTNGTDHKLSFEQVCDLLNRFFENEDRLYPRKIYKGSGMLMDKIMKLYTSRFTEWYQKKCLKE